ncbi:MAG: cell division protein FtsQ/DivIB [Pseudomonadota bacterium]|nr:cell division protein FtsQ/DivIB [Pseudomonadota bacterium]
MPRTLRRPEPPAPLPADVRLMNAIAGAIFMLAAAGVVAAGVCWLTRSPLFPIRVITIDGELARNSVPTIRANATPGLAGNFWSVDLQKSRTAFESVPWVRRAVVQRVFPDQLRVTLQEQRPAALWEGLRANASPDRLVNEQGEVFAANVGDVEDDDLPTLAGPDGQAGEMLMMLRRLQPVLMALDVHIDRLLLTARGSWRAELDSGATLEMGRGSIDEIADRTARFTRTLTQVTDRWQRPLEYADLRHADGYAVRLQGVSTTPDMTQAQFAKQAAAQAKLAAQAAAKAAARKARQPAANSNH